MYLGYCVKKNRLLTQTLTVQTYIILIVICVSAFLFGTVDVSQNVWKLGFFDYIASGISGFLLCKAIMCFECYEGKVAKLFRYMGRYSLYIFCIHTIEYLVFPWERVVKLFEGRAWIGILAVLFLRVIIISAGCVVVYKIARTLQKRKQR